MTADDPMLHEVEQWVEDLTVYLHELLEWSMKHPGEAVPLEPLYLLEYSVDLMLNSTFRNRFRSLLDQCPNAVKRFMASDPDSGQKFVQELGVISVIPPVAPELRGPIPTPTFPRPIVHHRARTKPDPTAIEPDNIRLLLDHIPFLNSHPQYLLICSKCGWVQGSLATAEAFASKVPHPCDQLSEWWNHLENREAIPASERSRFEGLLRAFREELWGYQVISQPAQRRSNLTRCPDSGDISKILDGVVVPDPYPDDWPGPLRKMDEQAKAQNLGLLAMLLAQIRCQICEAAGGIRYMPRFLLPIDADLSAASQAGQAVDLSERLDQARTRVKASSSAQKVLWIPKRLPSMKLIELAERFELRHEGRAEKNDRWRANPWLLAMWLLDVASTSARRRLKKGRAKGSARMTWRTLFEEVGIDPDPPRTPSQQDGDTRQMHALRRAVDSLVESKRDHRALASRVRDLLEQPAFRRARSLLALYYAEEILPAKLIELRRNFK